MSLGILCKGKPLESGSVGQMSHLGAGFLNAAQLSQIPPSQTLYPQLSKGGFDAPNWT